MIPSLLSEFRDQLICSDIPPLGFSLFQHWLERELLPRSSPWLIQLLADLRRIKLCTILRQTIESLEGIFPLCQNWAQGSSRHTGENFCRQFPFGRKNSTNCRNRSSNIGLLLRVGVGVETGSGSSAKCSQSNQLVSRDFTLLLINLAHELVFDIRQFLATTVQFAFTQLSSFVLFPGLIDFSFLSTETGIYLSLTLSTNALDEWVGSALSLKGTEVKAWLYIRVGEAGLIAFRKTTELLPIDGFTSERRRGFDFS